MENVEKNKQLLDRFPFLLPKDSETGEQIQNYDYSWSELDTLEVGWRKAFGMEMLEELRAILVQGNCLETYRIIQIKEKWGQLRWYDTGYPQSVSNEIEMWKEKWEERSEETCAACGEPAEIFSKSYCLPYCRHCGKGKE